MNEEFAGQQSAMKIVIVSGVHDFRTRKRGSLQFLALGLSQLGHAVTFVSLRFSLLSLLKGDSRSFLLRRANRFEQVAGIQCFLWFTLLHPFETKSAFFNKLMRPLLWIYENRANKCFDDSLQNADVIIIESGQGVLFAHRARRLNPNAKIIYRASDRLSTIRASKYVQERLERYSGVFDWICVLAPEIADDLAFAYDKIFYVPLGMNPEDFSLKEATPYKAALNAVSVGSMLFDQSFFEHAPLRFPQIEFHVIGSGRTFEAPSNVHFYDEMAFHQTLPFLKYASFGIAPYTDDPDTQYLATSSLKLKQYEYLGIPAVCPKFAVGASPNRYGYVPGETASIELAIQAALAAKFVPVPAPPNWTELAMRILSPQTYPDCNLGIARSSVSRADHDLSADTDRSRISLVVCTKGDRKDQLRRLLRSLQAQECKAFEVIVVDQNPPGFIDEVCDFAKLGITGKVVRSDTGLSKARNVGMRLATGEILAFPDDDCWYLPDTLSKVDHFFRMTRGSDILLGRTVDEMGRPSLSPAREDNGTVNNRNVWSSGNSNTLFVRRGLCCQSRILFDEQLGVGAPGPFKSGEETDFILKLMQAGARATYLYSLVICHDQVDDLKTERLWRRAWSYSLGFGRVLSTHQFGLAYLAYRVSRSLFGAVIALVSLRISYGISRVVWAIGTAVGYFSRSLV